MIELSDLVDFKDNTPVDQIVDIVVDNVVDKVRDKVGDKVGDKVADRDMVGLVKDKAALEISYNCVIFNDFADSQMLVRP